MADAAMSDPHKYDPIRATAREVLRQEFAEAGREVTRPQESAPTTQEPEQPFLTEEDKVAVARAAYVEKLDSQVREEKITPHERQYQLHRFEQTGREPESRHTARDGLMSSYVSDETKAEQKAAQAAREKQQGGRSGSGK